MNRGLSTVSSGVHRDPRHDDTGYKTTNYGAQGGAGSVAASDSRGGKKAAGEPRKRPLSGVNLKNPKRPNY